MRLLEIQQDGSISLTKDFIEDIPRYAILSHTWGDEEVTLEDLMNGAAVSKAGWSKITFCGQQAVEDGLQYFWVDTCCIDKTNSVELQEAINSMYRWYQAAEKCYVYLSDVATRQQPSQKIGDEQADIDWELAFHQSRWFRRGWTLQELLAPKSVEFFSCDYNQIGDKRTLEKQIHEITGIPFTALQGVDMSQFSIDERLSWMHGRQTTRKEDQAYSLFGIFDMYLPLLYGEGRDNAFKRLEEEIYKNYPARMSKYSQDFDQLEHEDLLSGSQSFPKGLSEASTISTTKSNDNFTLGLHLEGVHIIPYFTSRLEYRMSLESLLPTASSGRKVFVLYGLGGIGKTQLAINFAKDHQSKFSSTFFVNGSSLESLSRSFSSIYCHLVDSNVLKSRSEESKQLPPEQIMQQVLQWFALKDNNKWLLIFDNIDKEPADEGGFDPVLYFPPKDHGSILITSRLATMGMLGEANRVGRMSGAETMTLLNRISGYSATYRMTKNEHDGNSMNPLLEILDGLPLAITQAGQCIKVLNLTPTTYVELYTSSKREVIDMLSSHSKMHDGDKSSIRTTWTTSLNLLKEKASKQGSDGPCHAALRLLQLFAYFEPSDLSYNIIRHGIIGNNIPDWFRRTFSSKIQFFTVIKVLLDLCLIDNNISEGTYSMHRVVHDWLCIYVCGKTDQELLRLALGALHYSAPLIKTHRWFVEQQKLALHAVHLFPRLQNIVPENLLVRFDNMSETELGVVASLVDQPVICWKLLRFDLTLHGISKLLQGCKMFEIAQKITLEAVSGTSDAFDSETTGLTEWLLRYDRISCNLGSHEDLPIIAEEFRKRGSPSWATKALNLYALKLNSIGSPKKALNVWGNILDESRRHTGGIFIHPTFMVFNNLAGRLKHDAKRRKALYEKFEMDARKETDKVAEAWRFLFSLKAMRVNALPVI